MNHWLEATTGLRLLDPSALLLLLLVPLVLLARARRGAPAILFGPTAFLGGRPAPTPDAAPASPNPAVPTTWRQRALPLPTTLNVLGVGFAVIALARPVQRTPVPETSAGIDIMLCMDISSSMRANDLDEERTRLEVAKAAAAQFIAGRRHDRIGLVCFARYPDVRCPLTLDHHALLQILAEVTMVSDESQEDATGIGTALARSAQVLAAGAASSKVTIVLTDGEENVATAQTPEEIAPAHAALLCRELGVRAYTIAVGVGERGPGGDLRPLQTSAIERVALRTGGKFYTAPDAMAVAGVYADIDALERAALAEPRYHVDERFLPFLASALVLLLVARCLAATWLAVQP